MATKPTDGGSAHPLGATAFAHAAVPPAGAAFLLAPMAGAAAAGTALGFGLAAHAFGLWTGTLAGAAEAAERLFDEHVSDAAFAVRFDPPEGVRAAVGALVADAESAARRTRRRAEAAADDDLKAISGIGPKIERALKARGITRYADIAAWRAADVARIDAALAFKGRIARERWVEQAAALARGGA
ncbi:NADH:ubiquinone oxidoreductase [Aquibium sp. A9E412]|uniref:NADH:ubiquinone oxidoreductase n=1 Tax=Aquibium sp. A9E412 TaxID=2976767 RepID=UPI0025B00E55|nr:NADH:ubiquinone oxidoreductase [Aquibium sp. A9E412]MDN2567496.1 NADH:ubiquinone oxidoreductase [Aquibium sp. A9E412]